MPDETPLSPPPDPRDAKGEVTNFHDPELARHWLSAIIESAEDAIISKTLEGIITSWNKGAERIFGYRADEVIGKSITILIPADHPDEEPAILRRIRSGERVEHYETQRIRKDGTRLDISLTISPIRGPDGRIVGASKIARDITPRKQAEEALRRVSEESNRLRRLYETALSNTPDLVYVFNREGRFIYANRALLTMWGKTWEEAAGKNCLELGYEPWHAEMHEREIRQVIATRRPLRGEVPFTGTHGRRVYEYIFVPVFGADGEVEAVAGTTRDMTDRKLMEEERERLIRQLEWERARLSYLFVKAPAFIATVRGPEHVFELVNPSYLQLIGHREVIGKTAREALPEVEGQGFFKLLDRVFNTGEPYEGREMRLMVQRRPDAAPEERFVDFVYQPILEADGAVSGIFAHGVDITEQVSARRQAEEANRLKDEFLATLSHELRTPLTAILGWSRMMREGRLSEPERNRALDTIERNAQLQSQLIEDILDVSRIVTGKLRLEVRPVEPAAVIEAAVESVLPAAEAKGIRLQRVLDSGTSLVSGDPNRLQQVVWNLLTNAIKFTPKEGRVQVRLERVNSHVEIIVTDTGQGIRPEVLPYVFDRFRQADSSTTRKYGGLGLGLAIVRHLVEMHGGTVVAESPGEGQGATFTVSLPLIATRSAEGLADGRRERVHPTASGGVSFERPPELEGLHVLVVDDEEDTRFLVRAVLEQCGARVTTAGSAAEGLSALTRLRPDVMLSDLGMPGEDGYSLIEKVRALPAEQGGRTPAAALTAYARVEDRMKVLRSGFQIHLPKPVEPAELVTVVASLASWGSLV